MRYLSLGLKANLLSTIADNFKATHLIEKDPQVSPTFLSAQLQVFDSASINE